MVSTDPISDMFTRIRNAAMVNHHQVNLPHSKLKEGVARILSSNGYLKAVNVIEEDDRKSLQIDINDEARPATITHIKRLSTPGRRVYVQSKQIPSVKGGRGMVIISTSKGIMTGAEAANQKLGGELIGEVY